MTSTNGDDVAEFKRMTYAHTDALGNVEVVTDQQGQVLKRFRYDPFGQRHDITLIDIDLGRDGTISWSDAKQALARGFTGHESIETAGIIHMNGRIYDAVLQRFLSPDPLVQSPTQTQSHNRYAYVMNNPLKYVDPTGYSWLSKTWKKVKRAVKKYWRAAVAIVITIYTGGLAVGASSFWAGVGYAAAGGFAAGMVASGGDWRAGITGALTAAAFYSVWSAFQAMAKANGGTLSGGARVTKVIAHGTVGGASSAAQGGRFKDGFLSAGVTQALAPGIGKPDSSQLGFSVEGTLAAAVMGGTASVVGGGKFANGASTAAFLYTLRELPSIYKDVVGYDVDLGPGGKPVQKTELSPPVKGANNVGVQGGPVGDPCFGCEGGPVSRVANQIPGVNAVAGLHDQMQVSLGTGIARDVLNVPGMVPAAAFTYAAALGQPLQYLSNQQIIYLSVANSFDRDDDRRLIYGAAAVGAR
mgnify:CR=1 FL=1